MTRRARKRELRADVDPEPLNAVLERFTRNAGWEDALALARIREAWEEIVGGLLAPRCRPERLAEDATLIVGCDHGVIANEITMLTGPIVARAREIGGRPVERLDVRVRRRRG